MGKAYNWRMHNAKILIVEDDTDIRESLSDFLSYEGYQVASACNGQEALEHLTTTDVLPALIFLDLMMPVMDGHTFLEIISSKHPDFNIPIIILSAVAQSQANKKVVNFMRKPVNLEDIISMAIKYTQPQATIS